MARHDFGELLTDAFNDYKRHFPLLLKVALLLSFLPTFLFGSVGTVYRFLSPVAEGSIDWTALGIEAAAGVATGICTLLLVFTVIKLLVVRRTGRELTLVEALREGAAHYGTGLLLSITLLSALLGLYLLLIVPGIIFSILWTFAYYAHITDGKGVLDSLRRSKETVKGRWWLVFGYSLLLGLLVGSISVAVTIVPAVLSGILAFVDPVRGGLIGGLLLNFVVAISGAVLTPFSLIFMERFYLDLRANPLPSGPAEQAGKTDTGSGPTEAASERRRGQGKSELQKPRREDRPAERRAHITR